MVGSDPYRSEDMDQWEYVQYDRNGWTRPVVQTNPPHLCEDNGPGTAAVGLRHAGDLCDRM